MSKKTTRKAWRWWYWLPGCARREGLTVQWYHTAAEAQAGVGALLYPHNSWLWPKIKVRRSEHVTEGV